MLFNSVIFITLFLPVALFGWYGLKRISPVAAKVFLIAMSLWFYGYYNPWYLLILGGSLLINYAVSIGLFCMERQGTGQNHKPDEAGAVRTKSARKSQKLLLVCGIAVNVGLLFYFKYFNFFIENCNYFLHTDLQSEQIALPLGISFFTFQQIAFLVDRYRGEAPAYSFLDYCCFVTFFPQILSGPITKHNEFMPGLKNLKERKFDGEKFYEGMALFVLGLAKKVLLADVIALLTASVYDELGVVQYYLDIRTGWITVIFFGLQLYFDFSGYSDMARGLGKMFGFDLPVNFRSPYKASSVKEFWRRWHMTLGRFLTRYIYIPLGGNRKGMARTCINLLVVFLISGLWHGAAWTFVLWGALHGLAMVVETLFPRLRFKSEKLQVFTTRIFVLLSWVPFRCNSLADAGYFYRNMFVGAPKSFFYRIGGSLAIPENFAVLKVLGLLGDNYLTVFYFGMMLLLLVICLRLICGMEAEEWIKKYAWSKKGAFVLAALFVWVLISLSQVSSFLYFRF